MLDLVPAALAVCRRNLCGKRGSWQLALEILKGCQVLVARQTKDMRETHDEIYSLTDDQLREYIRTGKMPVTTPTDAYRRSA